MPASVQKPDSISSFLLYLVSAKLAVLFLAIGLIAFHAPLNGVLLPLLLLAIAAPFGVAVYLACYLCLGHASKTVEFAR